MRMLCSTASFISVIDSAKPLQAIIYLAHVA